MKSLAVDQRQKIIDAMEKKEYKELLKNAESLFSKLSHLHADFYL